MDNQFEVARQKVRDQKKRMHVYASASELVPTPELQSTLHTYVYVNGERKCLDGKTTEEMLTLDKLKVLPALGTSN